jgi:arginine deiminase
MTLRVHSEIGKLSSVLVHLPGAEIDRMVPAMMEELLFDDILFGARAREEHRRFQQVLGYVADEVLEARELLAEVLAIGTSRPILEDLSRASSGARTWSTAFGIFPRTAWLRLS